MNIKRYGNLYEKIYDIDNLRLAHKNAQRGKGFYSEVIEINKNPDEWLFKLQNMLKDKTYKTSEYETFIKNDSGKERVIYKLPYFPDRVCHWAIIQVVELYFLDKLNHCTHSAIPNRGIHSAFRQLDGYMKCDIKGTEFCYKSDIRKYYPSIPHDELKDMYRTIFKDPHLLWLIDEIIDAGGIIEPPDILDLDFEYELGVPIGNYLSQYSGNLYLYRYDRWLKEVLGVKYYIRYMDDMTILHNDKGYLHELHLQSEDYLMNNLKLHIKDDWQVFPSRIRGIDFVGYRHFGDYVLLRKSISKNLIRAMRDIDVKIVSGQPFTYTDYCCINSYKGWVKWCDGYNLYTRWIKPLEPYAQQYYERQIKIGQLGGIVIEKI